MNQARTAAEVAADEEGFYLFVEAVAILAFVLMSAYGGWQIGLWMVGQGILL